MWMRQITAPFLLLFTSQAFTLAEPGDLKNIVFTAKVIRIMDGDTMEVLYQNTPIKVRLEHIDYPEKRGNNPLATMQKLPYLIYASDKR